MKMKLTWNEKSTLTKTKDETQTPQSDTIDNLHFSFFSTDESEINAGIGMGIDPNHNFDQSMPDNTSSVEEADLVESAEVDDDVPTLESDTSKHQTDAPDTPAAEPEKEQSSGLIIHSDESIELESSQPEPDNIVEKSAKLFAETRKAMDTVDSRLAVDSLRIDSAKIDQKLTPSNQDLYNIVDDDVEPTLFIDDLQKFEKLEEEYQDKIIPVKEKMVEVEMHVEANKKTAADRVGIAVDWTIRKLVKDPVKVLFTVLHNGIKSFFSSVGNLLIWGFFSIVLIVCFYVLICNFSDSGQSAEDMIFQAYEAVKKVLVTLYKEVSSNFGGKKG
ncbi:MAG: hypothetical protein E6230_06730 [Paenibacillus dendritiformis]|jgi:hypothetical protein|uniref:hypothetical protein n=1 Tax=uncultured Paenibacillus sp. TaxID=227322 RepID=UPI0025CBD056|nr:hypothetical protein [uncultured Paenibacillus sp.]MDU5141857.1 hypothetical protein [Paenibacillus dendritiformis]